MFWYRCNRMSHLPSVKRTDVIIDEGVRIYPHGTTSSQQILVEEEARECVMCHNSLIATLAQVESQRPETVNFDEWVPENSFGVQLLLETANKLPPKAQVTWDKIKWMTHLRRSEICTAIEIILLRSPMKCSGPAENTTWTTVSFALSAARAMVSDTVGTYPRIGPGRTNSKSAAPMALAKVQTIGETS